MTARKRLAAPALKVPLEGDSTALDDLQEQRTLLQTKLRSKEISARDLTTVSAELRKVNATISIVQGQSTNGGIAEEDLAARAAVVRAMLLKTKAERERAKVAAVPPAEPEADPGAEPHATGTG